MPFLQTSGTIEKCTNVANKYGSYCVSFANDKFTMGNMHVFSNGKRQLDVCAVLDTEP